MCIFLSVGLPACLSDWSFLHFILLGTSPNYILQIVHGTREPYVQP